MTHFINKIYFLRFIQSALPHIDECDLQYVADNSTSHARDLVGLFRFISDKEINSELSESNIISDNRISLISNQSIQMDLSGNYRFRRFFVDEGEVIYYEFITGERYILLVEF